MRTHVTAVLLCGVLALTGCSVATSQASGPAVPEPAAGSPSGSAPSEPVGESGPASGPAVAPTVEPAPDPVVAAPEPSGEPAPEAPLDPAPEPSVEPAPDVSAQPAPPVDDGTMRPGESGPDVLAAQQRLAELGYWAGTPDGSYGSLTSQAVLALQKAAGLSRDGVLGPRTQEALAAGTRPQARNPGDGVEIDLERQLLLVVRDGQVRTALNTSTGVVGEYDTPRGEFRVGRAIDGLRIAPLGELWRPRYFNGGIAVHGSPSIPGYPASHGCARLSNAAIDMVWAQDLMPIGSPVTVY